jgi:16S rRNA (guanine(966)-N(2))-methyltransferase RsmD
MRVIAGKYRSRIIKMPKGLKIRPTKDRIREALFGIIGEHAIEARVLDVFAGSGAFGIEALSRGAKRAVFVDNDIRCIKTIRQNLKDLHIYENNNLILRINAFRAFSMLEERGELFDIVFLDPPYYKDMAKKSLIKLIRHDILHPPCLIIAEHHKNDILPKELDVLTSCRTVCYGDICLSFYKVKSNARKQG